MVTPSKNSSLKWLEPSPLWGDHSRWIRLPEQTQAEAPMILRFANDDFMEEMLAMLAQTPWRIAEWEARSETWRNPMPAPNPVYKSRANPAHARLYNGSKLILNQPASAALNTLPNGIDMSRAKNRSAPDQSPIKLYQAAQNRYYLVTASLISEEKGYPDYHLDLGNNERATFVVRALAPSQDETGTAEYAYVITPAGKVWKKVGPCIEPNDQTHKLIQGEEQLPLFPMNYPDRCGRYRQILGGLIPVGKREEWMAASAYAAQTHAGMISPVLATEGGARHLRDIFYADVVEPWRALIEQAQALKAGLPTDQNPFPNFASDWRPTSVANDKARTLKTARDQIQTGSWYILLDMANFIEKNLNNVWKAITNPQTSPEVSAAEQDFVDLLNNTTLSADYFVTVAVENFLVARNTIANATLWEELKAVWELEAALDYANWSAGAAVIPDSVFDRIAGEDFDADDRALFERMEADLATGTGLTLMDLVVYLNSHVPNLKKLGLEQITPTDLTADEQKAQMRLADLKSEDINALRTVIGVDDLADRRISLKHSLREALVAIKAYATALDDLKVQYDRRKPPADETRSPVIDPAWPHFLFPLADPDNDLELDRSAVVPAITADTTDLKGAAILVAKLDAMADLIDTLVPRPEIALEREVEMSMQPLLNPHEAKFVIRCVFERPNCGTLFPALLSRPTRQLEMAPFFDPEAPARAIRIPLPMDISPAGLRKYKKNAMFLISDMLCGKINKIKKLTLADLVLSVLPWPFHKDLPDVGPAGPCKQPGESLNLGMFCSLSIPIVTLCALILLIIMVQLFDIFFRWVPYLFVCLPIPGFKGKKDE